MSSWHVNVFRSINRFERKKNLGLAIEALESLLAANAGSAAAGVQHVHLVLAGGYDHLNTENVEHLAELQVLSLSLSLSSHTVHVDVMQHDSSAASVYHYTYASRLCYSCAQRSFASNSLTSCSPNMHLPAIIHFVLLIYRREWRRPA